MKPASLESLGWLRRKSAFILLMRGFRYTNSRDYPQALQDFETSFATLSAMPCDVLLTLHPEASGLWTKLEQREKKAMPDPFVNPKACKAYADAARAGLARRVAQENAGR